MSSARLDTLDHVVIAVSDLAAAAADYATLLGRQPSWRGSHPGQGTANVLFALANTYIELLAPVADGELATALRQRLATAGSGPVALAFGTSDLDAFVERMEGRGCAVATQAGEGVDSETKRRRAWRTATLPLPATRGVLIFAIEHATEGLAPAAFDVPQDEAVDAVDHVVVMSAEVEKSKQVYDEVLGLRLALDRNFDERGVRLLFFRIGGVTVEVGGALTTKSAAADLPVVEEAAEPDRLWGIAYRVADVDATRARLRGAGVDVSKVRKGHKRGTRVCTVSSGTHGVATLLIGPDGAAGGAV